MDFGFIDTLYTPLGTAGNYSATAYLHTLQCTVTHALGFLVFTSHILATDFSQSLQITHAVFLSQSNSVLAILLNSLGLHSPELDPVLDNCSVLLNTYL
jgi:hypothetical protein